MSLYDNVPRNVLDGWIVLAIDDHDASREIISDILSFYGANVVVAVDGEEGFQKAVELLPKFIISDIAMPKMDGWQLIEKLKLEPRTRDIPTIALTAHAMVGDRERAIRSGFHNYLSKPLDPLNFLSQILVLLDDIETFSDELQQRILTNQ